jgi:protein kinase A
MSKSPNRIKSIKKSGTIKTKDTKEEKIAKIKLEDYEIMQKLSKVNYGIVKLCQSIETDHYYTMKILKKVDLLDSKIAERLFNEYKILSKIYHPFIMQLKGIYTKDPKGLYYLFEFNQGGELAHLLERTFKFPEDQVRFYAASLVTVIDYLHRKNIVNRGIAPENIFLTSSGYIKLTNFHFAKILKSDYTYTLCGTPEYSSPEMLNRKGHGMTHDFWCLGIIIYHMLIGHTPFEDNDPFKTQTKIIKGNIEYPKLLSKNAKSLIKHLLKVDQKKRLGYGKNGIYEIINNPFFKGFDWKNLLLQNLDPPFVPSIKGNNDASNFKKYEENYFEEPEIEVDKEKDPFYKWD